MRRERNKKFLARVLKNSVSCLCLEITPTVIFLEVPLVGGGDNFSQIHSNRMSAFFILRPTPPFLFDGDIIKT